MRYLRIFCFVLALLVLNSGVEVFAFNENMSAESDKYAIELVQDEDLEEGRRRFVFDVSNKVSRKDSEIKLENMITEVVSLNVVKDRMIVFGGVQNAGSAVAIVDLLENEVIDVILCYRPRFSETKNYLIYEKFYPRFAPPEVRSDLILIYDLSKSPLDNRVGVMAKEYELFKKKGGRIGILKNIGLSEDVGYPIYPPENVEKKTYFVWVESEKLRHFVFPKGEYHWFNQEKLIVMLDKHDGEYWVVLVDIAKGLDNVETNKIKLKLPGDIYK